MKDKFQRILSLLSVLFHVFSLAGLLALGIFNPAMSEPLLVLFALLLFCGWLPLAFLASLWLLWRGRASLKSVFVWGGFQLFFALLLFGSQIQPAAVGLIAVMYFLLSIPLLFVVNILYACQCHSALGLIALGSLGLVWSIVLGWRIQGNIIEIFLDSLNQITNPLLWLNSVMGLAGAMVMAGLIAFFIEGFRVCIQEIGQ